MEDIAAQLNLSTKYLSSLLKQLTGRTAQQHIHDKLIEKAKEKLSTTELSVGEIAFQLGFEHSQNFSKLFKSKAEVSPREFRRAFNRMSLLHGITLTAPVQYTEHNLPAALSGAVHCIWALYGIPPKNMNGPLPYAE